MSAPDRGRVPDRVVELGAEVDRIVAAAAGRMLTESARAVEAAVRRHPALRTGVPVAPREPRVQIEVTVPVPVPQVGWWFRVVLAFTTGLGAGALVAGVVLVVAGAR